MGLSCLIYMHTRLNAPEDTFAMGDACVWGAHARVGDRRACIGMGAPREWLARTGSTRVGAGVRTRAGCHACTLVVPLYLSPTENLCKGFWLGYDFISFKTSETRRHSRKDFKSLIPSSSRPTSLCGNRTVRYGFIFSTFDQGGRCRCRCRRSG